MENIVKSNEDNTGSLDTVWFIPVGEVVSIPDAVDWVIVDSVVVAADTNWRTIDITQETPGMDEKPRKGKEGDGVSISVVGFIPGQDHRKTKQFNAMRHGRYLVIAKDQEGQKRLIGSLENPVRFKYEFDTGNKTSSRKGYTITFYQNAKDSPYFFESPFVEYPDDFSEDADFIRLDAYLASILGRVVAAEADIDALQASSADHESRLDIAESDIDTLTTDLDTAELAIIAVETQVDDHETRLDAAEANITQLGTDIEDGIQESKDYADALVVGLWDDRGNYDASTNLFPDTGGSGTAGAILKGDIYTVSVAGTLNSIPVGLGDTVRALIDTPGQTASNWAIAENNIGYVPEPAFSKNTAFNKKKATSQEVLDHTESENLITPAVISKHTMVTKLNLYTNFS